MKDKKNTQKELVRKHLLKYGSITTYEAFNRYGITRIHQYIYLLKKEGLAFENEDVTEENRYGHSVTYRVYKLLDSKKMEQAINGE